MRINITLILSILVAVGLVVLGFTAHQASLERNKLHTELENRTREIAWRLFPVLDTAEAGNRQPAFKALSDSVRQNYQITGISLFRSNGNILCDDHSCSLSRYSADYVTRAITSDTSLGIFFKVHQKSYFQYIAPAGDGTVSNRALVLYTDAGYIGKIIRQIWLRNFIRWFLQALLVSIVTLLIIRFGIFGPIDKIVRWMKAARTGDLKTLNQDPPAEFLKPLHNEVVRIALAMQEAREKADAEFRLRSGGESAWTADRLQAEVESLLPGKTIVVVSNREPYMHMHEGKSIRCIIPASGMITAMEPILNACGGLWIASGSGDADRETVDEQDRLPVPPGNPRYTLRRIWLSKEEEDHYYYGFSNEGLWPLCHIAHTRPVFRTEDWAQYKQVNEHFARAVLEETRDNPEPLILIQDYHFSLLPRLIKKEKPGAKIALFWHIPWPNPESFGICPWQQEILTGMLGADLIGFHTQYHCNNFLETVNGAIESRVTWDNFSVKMKGHTTFIKPFPISIDFTAKDLDNDNTPPTPQQILQEHGIRASYLGIGVDRMDYTKGIIEKFLAIERFLEKYPQYIGQFTFIQIGAPSRTLLKAYANLVSDVENEANRINWRFKNKDWKPIILQKRHHSHEEIEPYYAAANVCMVTSLHDGMNLVAKEYIAARTNNTGALILSRFAGAAKELQGAIVINPYDIEKMAEAIRFALEMPGDEQQKRMSQMRQHITENNVYTWASALLRSLSGV